jgi:hypothetical protein
MGNIYDHNKTHGKKGPPRWYCRYADIDGIRKNRPTHQAAYADAMRFLRVVEDRIARGVPGIPEGDDPSFREELTAALGNPKLPRPRPSRPSPPPSQAMLARRPPSPAPALWGIAPPPPPTSSLQASADPQPQAIGELGAGLDHPTATAGPRRSGRSMPTGSTSTAGPRRGRADHPGEELGGLDGLDAPALGGAAPITPRAWSWAGSM